MAKMTMHAQDTLLTELEHLIADTEQVAVEALQTGAGIIADEMRQRVKGLPSDEFRHLSEGETFKGIADFQRKDLLDSLGITKVDVDDNGTFNVKVGFDGYGSMPTQKYPKGLPNPLLARAIESGSTVRVKTPFVQPTINKTKKKVLEAMQKVVDRHVEKLK